MSSLPDAELIALLRLQNVPKIGDVNAKRLLEKCGSAQQIFRERKQVLQGIPGIGSVTLSGLFDNVHLEEAEKEFEFIKENAVGHLFFKDDEYPKLLKHCIDAPILMFKRGNIDFSQRKVISVVGTRNITGYGTAFIEEFMEEIAPLDPIIVSGFAYGVDIAAQRAAMANNLQTVGCLAHGLNQIYPKVHQKYVSKIENNGGFMTEFWSSSNPERENFLKRNRIIAGAAETTIVVESAERGGSLVTADIAHGYHREVFAVPGRSTDKYSIGCNNLIKQQRAHLLTSAADLVYLLGWELTKKIEGPVQRELFVELDETEKSIYQYLQLNGKQLLDTVALECRLPIFKTSSSLLNMEMKGVIRPLPGKLFEAI